jgi:Helix-turn-helix domain
MSLERELDRLPKMLSTGEAARILRRSPYTLRDWAKGDNPLRAIKVKGRLLWPLEEIKRSLAGNQ